MGGAQLIALLDDDDTIMMDACGILLEQYNRNFDPKFCSTWN